MRYPLPAILLALLLVACGSEPSQSPPDAAPVDAAPDAPPDAPDAPGDTATADDAPEVLQDVSHDSQGGDVAAVGDVLRDASPDAGPVDAARDVAAVGDASDASTRPTLEARVDRPQVWLSVGGETPRRIEGVCGVDPGGGLHIYSPTVDAPMVYAVFQRLSLSLSTLAERCGGASQVIAAATFELSAIYETAGMRRINGRAVGTRSSTACGPRVSVELIALGCEVR